MSTVLENVAAPVIVGRSSSHFTRVARIFAAELRVAHSFVVLHDLMSSDPADYAGNPALKLPALKTPRGVFFGALNICRELWRQSIARPPILWPDDLEEPLLANAQELTVQAMSTEVALIMEKVAGNDADGAHLAKMRKSLIGTMSWLEDNVTNLLRALPADRALSYLEVTLFCLVTHLEFRDVLPTSSYPELVKFCRRFAERPSAVATPFRFDT